MPFLMQGLVFFLNQPNKIHVVNDTTALDIALKFIATSFGFTLMPCFIKTTKVIKEKG